MKKITILALHLGYGGIERCISSLANSLCDEYEVEIVSTYKLYEQPGFYIHPDVHITYLLNDLKPNHEELNRYRHPKYILRLVKEIFKAIKVLYLRKKKMIAYIRTCESDIIISTRDIHNLWLSKYGSNKCRKIGWEHNHHNDDEAYIKRIVESAKGLDDLVLVSASLTAFYAERLKDTPCRCSYIPNGIEYIPEQPSDVMSTNIISVGRLSKEKGFDDTVAVYEKIHAIHPEWKLHIVGDGLEKNAIQDLIEQKKLEDAIRLHGFLNRDSIDNLLAHSSIYLMTSHTESFGIVLLEAFAFGLPCIAFDSAQGACELIEDGIDGYLIKDRNIDVMAQTTCMLIEDIKLRKELSLNGYKKVHNYSIQHITSQWIDMLMDIN